MNYPLKVIEFDKEYELSIPEVVLGQRAQLVSGDGWIIYSRRKEREEVVTVISGYLPILHAINEQQKRNWEGLKLIARPVMIREVGE